MRKKSINTEIKENEGKRRSTVKKNEKKGGETGECEKRKLRDGQETKMGGKGMGEGGKERKKEESLRRRDGKSRKMRRGEGK